MSKQFLKGIVKKRKDGKIEFVATDETMDRQGESLSIDSWDLTNFMKAPRLLVNHEYNVQSIVGAVKNIRKEGKQIIFEPIFHGITELAKNSEKMVREGWLNTVSVGYIPTGEGDSQRNELLEVSLVAVPANPSALQLLQYKKLGDKDQKAVEKFIDEQKCDEEEEKARIDDVCDPDHPDYDPEECQRLRDEEEGSGHDDDEKAEKVHEECDPDNPKYDPEECQRLLEEDEENSDHEDDGKAGEKDKVKEAVAKVKQEETTIQTIILSKEVFPTLEDAKKWAKDNEFKSDKVDETETSWRFRQIDPSECKEDTLRTITLTEGVKAVICRPKKCAECEARKGGRILSGKTREQIKQSISVLQKLLDESGEATAPAKDGDIDPDGGPDEKKEAGGLVSISLETLKEIQSFNRSADKQNELIARIVKGVLKQQ